MVRYDRLYNTFYNNDNINNNGVWGKYIQLLYECVPEVPECVQGGR